MMGNAWEWVETEINSVRGIRGGSYLSKSYPPFLSSSQNWYSHPIIEDGDLGFRVASIPEPATLLILGLGAVIVRKR